MPKSTPEPPKVGHFFFPVVPKFPPRKSDRKVVRNVGAHNFHDIWAFGGPDLVKNGHFFYNGGLPANFIQKV